MIVHVCMVVQCLASVLCIYSLLYSVVTVRAGLGASLIYGSAVSLDSVIII